MPEVPGSNSTRRASLVSWRGPVGISVFLARRFLLQDYRSSNIGAGLLIVVLLAAVSLEPTLILGLFCIA